MAWRAVRCRSAESALVSGSTLDTSALTHALEQLQADIHPGNTMGRSLSKNGACRKGALLPLLAGMKYKIRCIAVLHCVQDDAMS